MEGNRETTEKNLISEICKHQLLIEKGALCYVKYLD